jgi:hypothetical protein
MMDDQEFDSFLFPSDEGGPDEAQVGPYVVKRSDGFRGPWLPGTTDDDVDVAMGTVAAIAAARASSIVARADSEAADTGG